MIIVLMWIATICSLIVLLPYKALAPPKSKSGHDAVFELHSSHKKIPHISALSSSSINKSKT